jgi:hypothetical protein
MKKLDKPGPRVFASDEEACAAETNNQQQYSLAIDDQPICVVSAVSRQEAAAAYVAHIGGVFTRLTDRDKLDASRRALAKLKSPVPATA